MGNLFSQSSSATVKNINDSISKNIFTALQQSSNVINAQQQISGKCDTEAIQNLSKNYTKCILENVDNFSTDEVLDLCSVFTSVCKMSDIDLSSNLNVDMLGEVTDKVKQSTKDAVNNTLSQYGGKKTDQYITNITNSMDSIITNIISELTTNTDLQQTVDLRNYGGEFISFKTSLNVINKSIQDNTVIQENVSNISNIISQTADNQSTIYRSLLIMFLMVAMSGIMISIIMTLRRSSDLGDFLSRMLPYIVWVLLSILVTVIHVLLMPDYTSYYDKDGVKNLDNKKLFFTLLGYYLAFYLIIFLVYKISQRNK